MPSTTTSATCQPVSWTRGRRRTPWPGTSGGSCQRRSSTSRSWTRSMCGCGPSWTPPSTRPRNPLCPSRARRSTAYGRRRAGRPSIRTSTTSLPRSAREQGDARRRAGPLGVQCDGEPGRHLQRSGRGSLEDRGRAPARGARDGGRRPAGGDAPESRRRRGLADGRGAQRDTRGIGPYGKRRQPPDPALRDTAPRSRNRRFGPHSDQAAMGGIPMRVSCALRSIMAAVSVAFIASACVLSVNDRDDEPRGIPGDTVWSQEIEMLEGQVAHIDSRALSIYLEDTGVDSAVVTLTNAGVERTVTLRTGLAGEETVPPYTVKLVYTGINGSATIRVTKFRV